MLNCSDIVFSLVGHEGNLVSLDQHLFFLLKRLSVQFSSVARSCLTLCNPMNRIIHGVAMMIKGRNLGGHDLETRAHSEGKALATES